MSSTLFTNTSYYTKSNTFTSKNNKFKSDDIFDNDDNYLCWQYQEYIEGTKYQNSSDSSDEDDNYCKYLDYLYEKDDVNECLKELTMGDNKPNTEAKQVSEIGNHDGQEKKEYFYRFVQLCIKLPDQQHEK